MNLFRIFTKENKEVRSAPAQSAYLIAGLGNPGREYRKNRHNIGFMALDLLAERLDLNFTRMEHKAMVVKGSYGGHKLILAKPLSYMNLSGQPVSTIMRFYKIPIERLLVIYDDVDLPLGSIRLRPGGGSGGHKGMQSIIERLGREDFPRLRLGIGRPPGKKGAADYVLKDFSKQEMETVNFTLQRAVDAVLMVITQGLEAAMTRYNTAPKDESA